MKKINLNEIDPDTDSGTSEHMFREQSCHIDGNIDVFFENLDRYLAERIMDADLVVGCMAWLTSRRVLEALARTKHGCQIVVQKEDWLRPGIVGRNELQSMYSRLDCPDRFDLPLRTAAGTARGGLSYCGDPTCQPVRVMGIRHQKGHNGPRMHHKFLVFCKERLDLANQPDGEHCVDYEPYAVWTGSFNATENGAMSRENAIFIRSERLARLYCQEWTRTLALSEPLDWSSDYVEPEWRFGS